MDNINANILLELPYDDLLNACKSSPDFLRVCRQPYFWEQKALQDFNISRDAFYQIEARDNKAAYEYLMKTNPNSGLIEAAYRGHLDLANYFINQGANDYNNAMVNAAGGGRLNVVNRMIELGANNNYYNQAMIEAAKGGHLNVINRMIEKGANEYDMAMAFAAREGHLNIVNRMIEKGANDYNRAMRFATIGRHLDIVNRLKQVMNSQRQ